MAIIRFYDGFHPTHDAYAFVSDDKAAALKQDAISLHEALSRHQLNRLNKHFCGIKGCLCGGVSRAKIEIINKR